MKVVVSRSGGFAGIRVTWQVSVDDQPDAADWIVLIRRLPWDAVPATPAQPDRFVYRIRCEQPDDDAVPDREATLAEQQVSGPWRELVDRVKQASPKPEKPAKPTVVE